MRWDGGVAAKPGNKRPTSASEWENYCQRSRRVLRSLPGRDRHIAGREENLDELLRVPGIDEPEINVHGAVHRTFVSGEQAFGLARTIEHFVKNVSAFLAAEYRKKNSAAKDKIDESGGVACKQPIGLSSKRALR